MGLLQLSLLAVGLSMDAFAVAVCAGLGMNKVSVKKSLVVGLYFGIFQAIMPLIGYLLASLFADMITAYAHWVAFALLCFLGFRMIYGSFKKEDYPDIKCPNETCNDRSRPKGEHSAQDEDSLTPKQMIPLALATSVDALAVGVSFAFLQVNIISAILFIGIITFGLSMIGVKIGNIFGSKFKSKAEFAGGAILLLIGFNIIVEHINILSF